MEGGSRWMLVSEISASESREPKGFLPPVPGSSASPRLPLPSPEKAIVVGLIARFSLLHIHTGSRGERQQRR